MTEVYVDFAIVVGACGGGCGSGNGLPLADTLPPIVMSTKLEAKLMVIVSACTVLNNSMAMKR